MNWQTQYWSSQKFTCIIPKQLKVNLVEIIEVQSDTLLKHWEVLWNLLSHWFTSIFWRLVCSHVLFIKQQCHILFADNVSEVLIEFLHQADDIIVYVTIGTAMVKWPKSSQESWIETDFWQLRGSMNLILYLCFPWIYKADTQMTPKALYQKCIPEAIYCTWCEHQYYNWYVWSSYGGLLYLGSSLQKMAMMCCGMSSSSFDSNVSLVFLGLYLHMLILSCEKRWRVIPLFDFQD